MIVNPRLRFNDDETRYPGTVRAKLGSPLSATQPNCRLEYAVTVSFLHEERVRLQDSAGAADGPPSSARGAEVSVPFRAGRARARCRGHRKPASKVSDPIAVPVWSMNAPLDDTRAPFHEPRSSCVRVRPR